MKAVIFDIDGTMVPNTPYHEQAFIELGRRHQIPITAKDYQQRFHARTNKEIIKDMFGPETLEQKILELSYEKEQIYREIYSSWLSEVPGLKTLIADLRANKIKCCAASNGPRENVQMVIKLLDLSQQLEFALSYEDVTRGKPAPDLFLESAHRMGVAPQDCLVIEDSLTGFAAARSAGMKFIAVRSHCSGDSVLTATDALLVIEDFTGLSFSKLIQTW